MQPHPSIKADTQVTLGFQGLTGVGYVEMAGGSPSLPPIWEAQPNPTIIATRSSMQDLLAGARTILARADETLQTLEQTVSDNSDDISLAVLDVRKFTSALAENSDGIGRARRERLDRRDQHRRRHDEARRHRQQERGADLGRRCRRR